MSQFYAQINYTVSNFQHIHRMRVAIDSGYTPVIGDSPNDVELTVAGGTKSFQEAMAGYSALLCGMCTAEMTINSVEMWEYPFGTANNGVWYAAAAPNDASNPLTVQGVVPAPPGLAHATIFTLRTSIGGIGRAIISEAVYAFDEQRSVALLPPEAVPYVDALLSVDEPYVDAQGGKFQALKTMSASQNEKLWRRRNR